MLPAGLLPLAAGLPGVAVAAACCSGLGQLRSLPRALPRCRKGLASSAAAPTAASAPEAAAGEAYAAATKQISLTINGRAVQVPEGSSILTAATSLGIHVRRRQQDRACRSALPPRTVCRPAQRCPLAPRFTVSTRCPPKRPQVPTLCTHPRLPTTPGTCRLCLVEAGGLKPACATPVWEGMQVICCCGEQQPTAGEPAMCSTPMTCAACRLYRWSCMPAAQLHVTHS